MKHTQTNKHIVQNNSTEYCRTSELAELLSCPTRSPYPTPAVTCRDSKLTTTITTMMTMMMVICIDLQIFKFSKFSRYMYVYMHACMYDHPFIIES